MGDPKRGRKRYITPVRPWDRSRLERDTQLVIKYGLRNKRELWRFQNLLRKYRRVARELLGKINLPGKEGEIAKAKVQAVTKRLQKFGILSENSTLDDVLGLSVENFLERRLQTIVYRQGLAKTIKQARQVIVHGHVEVDGRKVTCPSYIVHKDLESKVALRVKGNA
ncbi:MAG: 30S ribosomal protein S4 [Archaeoglobaceae archaeon]|nr:30S ribosomal protein S4 [Archaeoglobaceae archaeon]MDW7989294.1 30S ribosomal protein S4 [Archaeoglobaceae archaeon]